MAAFRRVIELNPTRGDAHLQLGLLHETGGRLNDALDEFRQALRLAPCNVEAMRGMGRVMAATGDTGGSQTQLAIARALSGTGR
jgi:cytochrome c-type biogenesis protein CcmH/NrfG